MIEELLLKVGIPTFKTNLTTTLVNGQSFLGEEAPKNIGWIYGLSLNVGGVWADTNKTLVSFADSAKLWLTFKIGSSDFFERVRMDNLVYNQPGVTRTQDRNYMPCSIPLALDWKKSYIENNENKTGYVVLDMHYIDLPSYEQLLRSNVLWKTGINPKM